VLTPFFGYGKGRESWSGACAISYDVCCFLDLSRLPSIPIVKRGSTEKGFFFLASLLEAKSG
jgi:hypothetical protein